MKDLWCNGFLKRSGIQPGQISMQSVIVYNNQLIVRKSGTEQIYFVIQGTNNINASSKVQQSIYTHEWCSYIIIIIFI